MRSWRSVLQFVAGEEIPDLEGGGVFGVGAVDGVLFDGAGEHLADGSLFGVGGVGSAHELAESGDSVSLCWIQFQDHGKDGAAGHEGGEVVEEGAGGMDVVEAFGLRFRERQLLDGNDPEAGLFDLGEDGAGGAFADGVGLDDAEGALGHGFIVTV